MLETYSLKQYKNNGDKLIWTVSSLNRHQNVQYHIFENNGSGTYEKMISTIDNEVDFIQIGALVAVGKYVIQPGDTLSEIALRFEASVEKLLDDNQNIINPDLIYAYDYLVIK